MAWIIFFVFPLVLYAILISYFFYGWIKTEKPSLNNSDAEEQTDIFLSVIVPFRNEESNITDVFKDLCNQHFPDNKFEVIFINDHSTDASLTLLKKQDFPKNFRLLDLPEKIYGKKSAINHAVSKAANEYLVFTDADCRIPNQWLNTIHEGFMQTGSDMILGPVALYGANMFCRIQKIEFASLMAIAGGSTGIDHSVLANGANMAGKKKFWLKKFDKAYENSPSGDDMFMLEKIKKSGGKIRFLKSTDAIVKTKCQRNLNDFLNQRLRWSSKSGKFTDLDILITGIIVTISNISLFALFITGVLNPYFLRLLFILVSLKFVLDALFLWPVLNFFQIKNRYLLIPVQLLYPMYFVIFSTLSMVFSFTWKDRKYPDTPTLP